MYSLYRLPVAKNHYLGYISTFLGLLYQPPFTDDGQIWCAIADHGIRLRAKFRINWLILLPFGGEKPQFLPYFGLWHLVVLLIGSNQRKFSTTAQLQTFPNPMVSKSFLYSNAFIAKSGAQTLMFERQTDRQTERHTKNSSLRRRVKSEPHQTLAR